MDVPVLRTARLALREWRPEDLDALAATAADAEVMELLGGTTDRAESDAFGERCRAELAERGFGFRVIEAPGRAAFIGLAGLAVSPAEAPFAPAVAIGWRLARAYWGHGYATEAASAVLADGFGRLGLAEIVATTTPMNRRSRAVMDRLGMRRDPDGDFDHPNVPEGHRLCRHVLYRLSRADWEAQS